MSSRRLLVLLKHLPDDSAFKRAAADWPLNAQLSAGMWNEIKAMRGDLWAFLGHERMPYKPVLSPAALEQKRREVKKSRELHDSIVARLKGERR